MNSKPLPLSGSQAQLFVADTCDLACDGCPYPNQTPELKRAIRDKELTVVQWREITDYLHVNGIRLFCLIGGEPASYKEINQVIAGITKYPDSFVILSTSGIHLLHNERLRKAVGQALTRTQGREFKNGVAISCDVIPSNKKLTVKNSRALKAQQGIEFIRVMQKEFPNGLTYVANVMVTPHNLKTIPAMQNFLEQEGIYINLCTIQGKCFGSKEAVFNHTHLSDLSKVGKEMIKRKLKGKLIVNSALFLSQLPGIIGMEDYHCWEEIHGNPVLDIGSDGTFRYCNWIGSNLPGGPPGIPAKALMSYQVRYNAFWKKSKEITKMLCTGCSWSRRDRGLEPMVSFNPGIMQANLPFLDPRDPKLQNIWVQAQKSVL